MGEERTIDVSIGNPYVKPTKKLIVLVKHNIVSTFSP
jgi:hypothetical protein